MTRTARLLLATSLRGDPEAELRRVLPYARALSATVRLVHVAPDPVLLYSEFTATALGDIEAAVEQQVAEARTRLDDAVARAGAAGVPVEVEVRRGDPRHGIVESARSWGATVVAVHPGEHGLAERLLLGTTSRHLLHHLDLPVLLLRPGPDREGGLAEIVVAVDPLEPDLTPPDEVLGALALALPARLRFVSVLAEEDLLRGRAREECGAAARSRLDRLLHALRRDAHPDLQHLGEVVYARKASDGILRFAEEVGATLIALRSHGRGAASRALLGSVCDQVASRATCSVLVFPAR